MDVTIRNVNDDLFRNFKAKCAEIGISMGEGFDQLSSSWLANSNSAPKKETYEKEPNSKFPDMHKMNDLSGHIRKLHTQFKENKQK
jgi:hypothetical protein